MIYLAFFQNQDMFEIGIGSTEMIIIAVSVIAVLLSILLPLLFLRKFFRNMRQTQTLLATGEPAQAKILKLSDTGTTINDNPQVRLLLEVHPLNRTPYQVETMCLVSRLRISQVQPGAVVAVKIDRQNAMNVALELA